MTQKFVDLDTYFSLNPSQMADSILQCPECGRPHKIPFRIVRAGDHLISMIPDVIEAILDTDAEQIGVVYDKHIEEKLEDLFFNPFNSLLIPYIRIPLGEKGQLLEAAVEIGDKAAEDSPTTVDFLMGVGSGVISDLTKWIATKRGLPFLLLGTAASMNAYTSITGTMTENNVKTSKWLDPASAVLLDSKLLASAPTEMTCAGICDILARNISNADWKLSQILRGTYFCPVPFLMMNPYQDDVLSRVEGLGKNEPEAMKALGDAVLVSGYTMTVLDGKTSPSSGSEHVISHFLDFQHEVFDLPKNLHGAQVGIGTIIMSAAFEILREVDPRKIIVDDLVQRRLSQTAINQDHQREFGAYGKSFDIVVAKKRIPDRAYYDYVNNILNSWEGLWEAVDPYLMPSEAIRQALSEAGAVTKLSGVKRSTEDAIQALLYGSHYRPRYTILDLLWELGLLPDIAPEILARSNVID